MNDKELRKSNKTIFANNQILKNVFEEYVLISKLCIGVKNAIAFGAHFAMIEQDLYTRLNIDETTPIKIYTRAIYQSMDKVTRIDDMLVKDNNIVVIKDGEEFIIGEILKDYHPDRISSTLINMFKDIDLFKPLKLTISDNDIDELLSKQKVAIDVGCGTMDTNHRLIPNIKNASSVDIAILDESEKYFTGAYVSKDLLVKKQVVEGLLVLNVYKFIK